MCEALIPALKAKESEIVRGFETLIDEALRNNGLVP